MRVKRILSMFLSVLLLVLSLASCDNTTVAPGAPDTSDILAVSDSDEANTEPAQEGLVLGMTDFDGAVLRVHGISKNRNFGYYSNDDIWVESDRPDPFYSSVYARMQDCLDKYNFSIAYTDSMRPRDDLASYVSGGLDVIDVICEEWKLMYNASLTGTLVDMKDVHSMDLSQKWYDQNAVTDLSIAGRTFYTGGDFSVLDDKGVVALYFNKTMASNRNMESPYDLVAKNQWTWDKFTEMCRAAVDDINGDGIDEDDYVGMYTVDGQFANWMLCVGEKIATLNNELVPEYSWLEDSDSVTKLEAVTGFMTDYEHVFNGRKYSAPDGNIYAYGRAKFAAGKHLFAFGGSNVIVEFTDMEDDFGIIPMPKWNSEQSRYYHSIDTTTPMFGIANTKSDYTALGYMIEYFSYEGMNTVTPAFKEKMLKRRYAQDVESADMLDLIYSTKAFDIGHCCDWKGVISAAHTQLKAGRVPKLSAFTRLKSAIITEIEQEYQDILNVGQ